jgi:hypothetical protein
MNVMNKDLRERLLIPPERLAALNAMLLNPDMRVIDDFLAVVARYGTPEEINARAAAARQLPVLREKVAQTRPEFLDDLDWLEEQRDNGVFISVADYRRKVLGPQADSMTFKDECAVTLEVARRNISPGWCRRSSGPLPNRRWSPAGSSACAR